MATSEAEEVLLDENAEAAKHTFYMVGALETSPDHKLLAYAEDTTGGEKYTLHVRELATGKELLKTPIKVGSVCPRACLFGCLLNGICRLLQSGLDI